jgi:hypothetical protein
MIYSYKPKLEDIIVSVFQHLQHPYYLTISDQIAAAGNRYGFRVKQDRLSVAEKNCVLKHAIVIVSTEDVESETNKYVELLDEYNTISLVFIYSSLQKMLSYKNVIEKLKLQYNDRLNFLRPDLELTSGEWVVSQEKLIDNSICDTVRIKYNPIKDNATQIALTQEYQDFFTQVSNLYTNYQLYHRSASDGFFAARLGEKFYITATKTYKNPLDLNRVSLVHYYDEQTNSLCYSGDFLPSSDVVEAAIVFSKNPEIISIVHTHASERYTRNPHFQDKIKVLRNSYGTPELGREINKVISAYLDDFIILEEHGEFFVMKGSLLEAPSKLEAMLIETPVTA